MTLSGPVAVAQDSLNDRVDRLQRELTTLQRQVFRGETPPAAAAAVPGTATGDVTTTQAARIELRLSQFESELRALTGQVEEFTFRMNQINGRLDKLVADVDLRLQSLEQRMQSGAVAAAPGAAVEAGGDGAAGTTGDAASAGAAPQATTQFDGGPQTLGAISQNDLQAFRQGQGGDAARVTPEAARSSATQTASVAGGSPSASPQEQYNYAFSLLRQAKYGEAEQALRSFVEQHSEDPLAGNAKYWLGETYYVRGDYQQSAVIFAEAFQQYPDSSKAPDNLLKLGMSLAALGNKDDACGTFAELLKRYPDASTTIKQRTRQEQRDYACS